jgi:glucose/arabinose dehydrogenase
VIRRAVPALIVVIVGFVGLFAVGRDAPTEVPATFALQAGSWMPHVNDTDKLTSSWFCPGLPASGDHTAKTVVVVGDRMFVNIGSATNSCQIENRVLHSPGIDPCPELCVRAGIWEFSANATDQSAASGTHFATGMRNSNALAYDAGRAQLWAAINGREQLHENWPELFDEQ